MKKVALLAILCLGAFSCWFEADDALAGSIIDTGGIGGGMLPGEGGSIGGGGGDSCVGPGGAYLVGCTGVSWLYYESTGKIVDDLEFTPINDGATVTIDKECSAHTEQGGGFWHFGRNASGLNYSGTEINYFGNLSYALGYVVGFPNLDNNSSLTSAYSTEYGYWGHMNTLNLNYLYAWRGQGADLYKIPIGAMLNNSLYKKDAYGNFIEMYKASRYSLEGSVDAPSDVMEAYKKACMYSGKSENECTTMPGDLRYFCYWDDMEKKEYTLTAYAITESGESLNGGRAIGEVTGEEGSRVSVGKKNYGGFSFVGWREERTGAVVSTSNSYVIERIASDKTVYAVYKPTISGASLSLQVKNQDVGNQYGKSVYAKPGDIISFKTDYTPVNTALKSVKPQQYRFADGGGIVSNRSYSISELITNRTGKQWGNGIEMTGLYSGTFNYGENSSDKTEEKTYKISSGNVGNVYSETANTIVNDTVVTPKSVAMGTNNGLTLATIDVGQMSDEVSVYVPYNFVGKAEITTKSGTLSAGESATVGFKFSTNPRWNEITKGEYATVAKGAKWRLRYTIDNNNWTTVKSGENVTSSGVSGSGTIHVPDEAAGTRIQVCAEMWPRDSGEYTNVSIDGYTDEWVSQCTTFTIGKKPSIQVWGGNVYSAGQIRTSVSSKGRTFGSWGELGVIAWKAPVGFGSGASLGYGGMSSTGELQIANSGNTSSSECARSLLTIPNEAQCKGGGPSIGLQSELTAITGSKNSVVTKYGLDDAPMDFTAPTGGSVRIGGGAENEVHYYYGKSDFSLSGNDTLSKGATYVVYAAANKTITISDNISFLDESYSKLSDLPKVIVYAEKVNIACNVNRIDALIIAEGSVNTCSNSSNVNDAIRSQQLRVNGAIVSAQLDARRTYGAASGDNSVVPAEIVMFDPSLYLFGGARTESGASLNLEVVNMKEMAPRA